MLDLKAQVLCFLKLCGKHSLIPPNELQLAMHTKPMKQEPLQSNATLSKLIYSQRPVKPVTGLALLLR